MAGPFRLTEKEMEAVKELESRYRDKLSPCLKEDETLFYRFLKARDFDVEKADTMLRKHIAWRKAFQVDTFIDIFKPKEVFLKHTGVSEIGFDKDGNLVRYAPTGKQDPRDIGYTIKMNDYMKHCIWIAECDQKRIKLENIKSGRKSYQEIFIFNLNGLTFASATSKLGADFFLRLLHLMQDNYPERMKYLIVINAPPFYTIVFSLLKKIMSGAMVKKVHVFGQDGWKEFLLKIIDADVLPAFLGGKRTDPDGDPSCKTFLLQGGRVPEEYYLPDEERYFKDMSKVKNVAVPPGLDHKILVEVKACDSFIEWEFEVKHRDIGFGLFHQESEEELEEVLPIQSIVTCDGTERGSFKCQSTGTYVIIFDNSHSWLHSKDVLYCVNVKETD